VGAIAERLALCPGDDATWPTPWRQRRNAVAAIYPREITPAVLDGTSCAQGGLKGRMSTFRFLPTPHYDASVQNLFSHAPIQVQEISMSNKTGDVAAPDLAADVAALRADIARLSDTIAGLMRGQADAAGAAVKGTVGDVRNQLSQAASHAQDSAFGAAADLERRIDKNPLTAVLIAAAIGVALGMMSKSRR
jgi:ElaB/YqjD/DUF883 family membrane-anchored ribosome-binding protein